MSKARNRCDSKNRLWKPKATTLLKNQLVGGLELFKNIFPYIGNNNPNWLNWLIFFRGAETTNQWNFRDESFQVTLRCVLKHGTLGNPRSSHVGCTRKIIPIHVYINVYIYIIIYIYNIYTYIYIYRNIHTCIFISHPLIQKICVWMTHLSQ